MEIGTILSLVEFAIQEEPKVAESLKNLFSKPNPTAADWEAERQAARASYRDLVPNSDLPPTPTLAPPPQAPA